MSTHAQEETSGALNTPVSKVPEWFWNLLLTLAVVVAGAIYVTGKVEGRLSGLEGAVLRIDQRMDSFMNPTRGPKDDPLLRLK